MKESENEWFKKHEILLLTTARREREMKEKQSREKAGAEEAAKLREAHWMRCPKCGYEMEEIGERGVKIDRCTKCGGVYLDQGELEEILLSKDSKRRSIFRSIANVITGEKLSD